MSKSRSKPTSTHCFRDKYNTSALKTSCTRKIPCTQNTPFHAPSRTSPPNKLQTKTAAGAAGRNQKWLIFQRAKMPLHAAALASAAAQRTQSARAKLRRLRRGPRPLPQIPPITPLSQGAGGGVLQRRRRQREAAAAAAPDPAEHVVAGRGPLACGHRLLTSGRSACELARLERLVLR